MHRSEESKEGKIEPFRSGPHPGKEGIAPGRIVEEEIQRLPSHAEKKEKEAKAKLIPLLVSRGGL